MNKTKILIIENTEVCHQLKAFLEKAGHHVYTASEGIGGMREVFQSRPHLVVLDTHLPGMDGWETCQRILQVVDLPIILLSANGAEEDKVRALQLGADDCLSKSSNLEELLLARVEATLRRSKQGGGDEESTVYSDGVVTIDQGLWEVYVRGQRVHTSALEFKLLTFLVQHPNQVVTYNQILDRVWGPNYDSTSSVKQYIGRLRRKIEDDPERPALILTVRGVGYRYFRPRYSSPSNGQLPLDLALNNLNTQLTAN